MLVCCLHHDHRLATPESPMGIKHTDQSTPVNCSLNIKQGVIWLEDELIGHARLAIEYFRKHKIGVAFVSNNATA